jgi:hypothetical protein
MHIQVIHFSESSSHGSLTVVNFRARDSTVRVMIIPVRCFTCGKVGDDKVLNFMFVCCDM